MVVISKTTEVIQRLESKCFDWWTRTAIICKKMSSQRASQNKKNWYPDSTPTTAASKKWNDKKHKDPSLAQARYLKKPSRTSLPTAHHHLFLQVYQTATLLRLMVCLLSAPRIVGWLCKARLLRHKLLLLRLLAVERVVASACGP